jgi:hypothetical protein
VVAALEHLSLDCPVLLVLPACLSLLTALRMLDIRAPTGVELPASQKSLLGLHRLSCREFSLAMTPWTGRSAVENSGTACNCKLGLCRCVRPTCACSRVRCWCLRGDCIGGWERSRPCLASAIRCRQGARGMELSEEVAGCARLVWWRWVAQTQRPEAVGLSFPLLTHTESGWSR